MDLSETRICEWRCFDATDTMNNLYAGSGLKPKYIIADIDTYKKGPEDDTYANFPVNYLKLDKTPGADDDFSPDPERASRRELLRHDRRDADHELRRRGRSARSDRSARTWSGPSRSRLSKWSGATARKSTAQIISATDLGAFGTKHFAIPFDATGKAWVRFAVWDTAGNGAFVQPVWLNGPKTTSE